MKIIALITARKGSKRLPGKNIIDLGGKPLIMWSIETLSNVKEIKDIIVSTDDKKVIEIAQKAGLNVPWIRPKNLCLDTTKSVDVALHALDWYEKDRGAIDGLLLIQPTSPFRTSKTVKKGIGLFIKSNMQTVISVTPTHQHPSWTFTIRNDYLVPYINENGMNVRSQDLEKTFVVNGSFYLISPNNLRTHNSFYSNKAVPLIISSKKESLDIDDESDLKMAQYYVSL